MQTPFNFGRTVKSECFTNREQEIKKLSSNFQNRINTIIISPRRWGKSSLVEKVAAQVRAKSLKVITIDLFGTRTEEEFYNTLTNAVIKATSSKAEEWIELGKKFLKSITPKFTVELGDKHNVSMELDHETIKKYYKELLDLPEKVAKEKNIDIVICIDEFQNIGTFSDHLALQKRLRSAWQHHERVTYCLYGSKQHMMMELFNKQSNPFYKFGELLYLPKITEQKWISYISRQFQKTKKEISTLQAAKIAQTVKCHPYYAQQLSHLVWINTDKKVTEAILFQSTQELLDQNAILYFKEAEDLNNTELNLMRAIAKNEKQLSSRDTIQRYRLGTSANVIKAKNTLIDKEIIDIHNGVAVFIDPVFELWFTQHLGN
ncbi:MAG: ATP-binding protein [Bacteroidetes bacterium]|nr:ATP-binding protein [Bacteroidota bacterium]